MIFNSLSDEKIVVFVPMDLWRKVAFYALRAIARGQNGYVRGAKAIFVRS